MSDDSPAPKRGVGQPTKYRPEYCQTVVDLGMEGASLTEMAVEIGIVRETLYAWRRRHPEFHEAVAYAMECSQAWWERQGRLYLTGDRESVKINAAVYSRSMSARFPKDWTERREDTQTHDIGAGLMDWLEEQRGPTGSG